MSSPDEQRSETAKRKRDETNDDTGVTSNASTAVAQERDLEPPPSKRQKPEIAQVVKSHYDSRPNNNVQSREQSPIIEVRHFNNWIKSVLIGQYVRAGDTVLDICGGKGGDFPKWNHGGIHHLVLAGTFLEAPADVYERLTVACVDIAHGSVKHAMERYNEQVHAGKMHFTLNLIAADCCTSDLLPLLDQTKAWFDLVNCQFALHYSFENEERARGLLKNISHRLKPGGWFIGTIPSAGWIMEKLRKSEGTSFGNDIYKISFEERDLAPPRFGAKYKFFLQDAVDDVPEYLVHTETLIQLAKQFDMEFVMSETLWNFYLANKDAQADLLRRMKVHDYQGNLQMTDSGKELSGLYKVFVFRKRGSPDDLRAMDQRGGRIDYSYRQYIPPLLEETDIFVPPPPAAQEAPKEHV